jgi:hypothetical protein
VRAFFTYTVLRLMLFVGTYVVLAGLWGLVVGKNGVLLVPLVLAVVVSSVLSIKLLARPREDLARVVQARAERTAGRYEEMRAREDTD